MNLSSYALFRAFARPGARRQDAPLARPRILVVDDEPGIRAFLMRVLAPIECEVVAAASGPEALQMFERTAPIDLLVSDLMMPVMNGLELGRRLQLVTPDLPILFLTGYSDALFEERPILGPNEAYVDKPISPAALYEAISMALYGRLDRLRRRDDVVTPTAAAMVQQTAWV
jgi:two-component system cell cycle sensor histidine kinase/response regulator CckA